MAPSHGRFSLSHKNISRWSLTISRILPCCRYFCCSSRKVFLPSPVCGRRQQKHPATAPLPISRDVEPSIALSSDFKSPNGQKKQGSQIKAGNFQFPQTGEAKGVREIDEPQPCIHGQAKRKRLRRNASPQTLASLTWATQHEAVSIRLNLFPLQFSALWYGAPDLLSRRVLRPEFDHLPHLGHSQSSLQSIRSSSSSVLALLSLRASRQWMQRVCLVQYV